jgi:hypothetical protein
VLKEVSGPKRDEVTGGWRKLHDEELHGLYSSPSIIRFEVLKAVKMSMLVFWLVTPCGLQP